MEDNAYNVLVKLYELLEKYDKFNEKEHAYALGLVVGLLEIYKVQQEEVKDPVKNLAKGFKLKF